MAQLKIAIVGAGVGGLASAARLSKTGHNVTVFEKLSECGGRNHMLIDQGFKFDLGPSFVLMPDLFAEVFADCGENIEDYLDLRILDPSYKIFYPDGRALTVRKDSALTKQELEAIEPGAAAAFDGFIRATANLYQEVRPLLFQCFTWKDLFNPRYWGLVSKMKVFDSYWQLARKYFKSEKLCYAFTFEAMFMGVSPFNAPAFYSIISYADHVQKIFHPIGGMYEIPKALERMGKKFGGRFLYNSEVKAIARRNGRIHLSVNGEDLAFDKVVVNADYAYSQTDLLRREIPRYKYSCSVYLLYLGLKRKVSGLGHHNLFFSRDLRKNLRQIFDQKVIPQDPSFYVHVPTVTDPALAPQGKDVFYILVPVANLENPKENVAAPEDRIRQTVFQSINQTLGINLQEMIEVEHAFYPQDFISRYNIKHGATFGLAHNLLQSAFFRPANFDSHIPGLYYVGASTQPGGGLPVVIAGSKIVADMIK
ncbi:MAG: phytoene desaturase [Candidatus Omnitrophica bacterium]|nr:phytoene desaturase [Candidatus Omnitrophota bacterium]